MNGNIEERISGYFDESLSGEEMAELAGWIRADPANARRFARAAMLHDRLQGEMKAIGEPRKGEKDHSISHEMAGSGRGGGCSADWGFSVLAFRPRRQRIRDDRSGRWSSIESWRTFGGGSSSIEIRSGPDAV